ncbi:MAG: ATP-binding protein [Rubripirellula sp.]
MRSKLVLSLAAIFFVFLTIDELVRQRVIEPEFALLERSGAIRDADRVLAALNAEVEHLHELAEQWASRINDEADGSKTVSSIRPGKWSSERRHWAAHVSTTGEWSWFASSAGEESTQQSQVDKSFHNLVHQLTQSGIKSSNGMTRIGDHLLVMYSVIGLDEFHESDTKTSNGYVVVGRHLDQATISKLRNQTQVAFSLEAPRSTPSDDRMVVWDSNQSALIVEIELSGIGREKLANLCVRVPRDITTGAIRTSRLARILFIFGSVAALLMLLVLLQRIVIGPLAAIREHSNRVAKEGFGIEPLLLTRNDEIGQLASAFDKMVLNLSDTQGQLTRASQAAGRSQVAGTVIHNVGNVLTNVNSLLDSASESVEGLRISPLHKLASRLRDSRGEEALLDATPDYLEGLASSLQSEQESIQTHLETLHDNICHIHDVIRDQQRHTSAAIKPTRICLKNIVEEAITYCRARLDDDLVSVQISGCYSAHVRSDRSLLLQSMINIIGNAHHAMHDSEGRDRVLTIETHESDEGIQIQFRDNGCGMSSETANRVFDAHFTTRDSGTGLGLHFCAITLKRLGGTIQAYSDGPGLGAMFVIELPLDRETVPVLSTISLPTQPPACVTNT